MTPALSAELGDILAGLDNARAKLVWFMAKASQPDPVVEPPPVVVEPPAPAGFRLAVQADGSLLVTGVDKVTWSLVKNSEAESWPWYGTLHEDVAVPATGLSIPVQQVEQDGDFLKVVYTAADGSLVGEDGPKTWKAPAKPPASLPPVAAGNPAFDMVKRMHMGSQPERMRVTTMNYKGVSLTKPDWYAYCLGLGLDFNRNFVPMNFTRDRGCGLGIPGDGIINASLDAAFASMKAGQICVWGGIDVMMPGEARDNWPAYLRHFENCMRLAKARNPDPLFFQPELINEMGDTGTDDNTYTDNTFWNPKRLALHAIARKYFPVPFVIAHGGTGWNNWRGFNDNWAMPSDNCIAAQTHIYDTRKNWREVADSLNAFSAKRGIPYYAGEFNGVMQDEPVNLMARNDANLADWLNNMDACSATAPEIRLCAWATTEASYFRMSMGGNDAAFPASVEARFRKISANAKAKLG